MRIMRNVCFVVVILFLLSNLYTYASTPTSGVVQSLAVYLIPFAVIIVITSGVLYTRKKHEEATRLIANGQTATFRENEYDLASEHKDSKGNHTYSYSAIHKACETKTMFYLYTSNNTATLIDKGGFTNGTPDDLRSLLRRNITESKCKSLRR